MIEAVRALMFAKISFPFVEKLVALVSPDTRIDTSFRIIDAIALLIAIPATIAYKVIFNEAPFKAGEPLQLPFGRVTAQSDVVSVFKGFVPFAGIFAAVAKLGKGIVGSFYAFAGDFSVGRVSVVGGVVFSALGVASMVFGLRNQEGSAVSVFDWTAIGAAGFGLVVSVVMALDKWNNPGTDMVPNSHKIDAGVDLCSTVAQFALITAAFGVIIDRLRQSSVRYDQVRQMPESFSWISSLLDNTGTVLVDIATIMPLAAAPVKAVLVAVGTAGKGGALVFKSLEVASISSVLEPLRQPA